MGGAALRGAAPPEIIQTAAVLFEFMPAFLYRCPITRLQVQGWTDHDSSDTDHFETVKCLACQQTHVVNPATGEVLGEEDE